MALSGRGAPGGDGALRGTAPAAPRWGLVGCGTRWHRSPAPCGIPAIPGCSLPPFPCLWGCVLTVGKQDGRFRSCAGAERGERFPWAGFLWFQLGGGVPWSIQRAPGVGQRDPETPGGGKGGEKRRIMKQLGLEGASKTVLFQRREAGGGFLSSPIGVPVCIR